MPSTWVAVDAEADALAWARLLRRAYNLAFQEGSAPARIVRPVITESWERSVAAGAQPVGCPPVVLTPEEASRRFAQHPLASVLPVVETVLVAFAQQARQVVVLADAEGMVLWTGGRVDLRASAERSHLMPGALWSEAAAGTNALGTALVLDHPVQVFSAEHFKEPLHGTSAAAAPIHDPVSGEILGVVELTGPLRAAHPHGYSLVVAAAQMIEAQLEHEAAERDGRLKVAYLQRVVSGCSTASAVVNREGRVLLATPQGWLGQELAVRDGVPESPLAPELRLERVGEDGGYLVFRTCGADLGLPQVRLEALGRERARVRVGHVDLALSPRHSEILVVLALHPEGLSHAELAEAVYGSSAKDVTVRAEVSRMRKLLGAVLETGPYRLSAEVRADFLEVERLLASGRPRLAIEGYPGPLLPGSAAPGVMPARERLEAAVEAERLSV